MFRRIDKAGKRIVDELFQAAFRYWQEDCKVAFLTAKNAKSAKEMLAKDIS